MEGADVELVAELLLSAFAESEDRELADLVGEGLAGPGDVAVGLALDLHLVQRGMVTEVLHDLVAGPAFRVQAGVDDEADRAEHLVVQAAVVAVGIVVETDLLAEALGVESPALDERILAALLAKRREVVELLLNRELQ